MQKKQKTEVNEWFGVILLNMFKRLESEMETTFTLLHGFLLVLCTLVLQVLLVTVYRRYGKQNEVLDKKFYIAMKSLSKTAEGIPIQIKSCKKDKTIAFTQLDKLFEQKCKVAILGSFKVGKSTIGNSLIGKEVFMTSDISNTKDEVFFVDDENHVVYIDTEGFNQPMDGEDPIVKQDLIMEHLRESCNILIFVVSRVNMQDLVLLDRLVQMNKMSPNIKRLIVVHNLQMIEDRAQLANYLHKIQTEVFPEFIGAERKHAPLPQQQQQQQQQQLPQPHNGAYSFEVFINEYEIISHYVVGNKYKLKDVYDAAIGQIRNHLSARSKSNFSLPFGKALLRTIKRYYAFDAIQMVNSRNESLYHEHTSSNAKREWAIDGRFDLDELKLTMANKHQRVKFNDFKMCTLVQYNYYWVAVTDTPNELVLALECPAFKFRKVEIVDPRTVQIVGTKFDNTGNDIGVVIPVTSPCLINSLELPTVQQTTLGVFYVVFKPAERLVNVHQVAQLIGSPSPLELVEDSPPVTPDKGVAPPPLF